MAEGALFAAHLCAGDARHRQTVRVTIEEGEQDYASPMHDDRCAMRYGGRFYGRVSCAGRESNSSQ